MPILFSYGITNADTNDHNRIRSQFERFGWEGIGGSCYRYPKLNSKKKTEDWLNSVIPALMCFRAYIESKKINLVKYSIDSHVSSGASALKGIKIENSPSDDPTSTAFGKKNLTKWLDGVTDTMPY